MILDEEGSKLLQSSTFFKEYVECSTGVITSKLRMIDELVEENLQVDVSSDEENSKELISH